MYYKTLYDMLFGNGILSLFVGVMKMYFKYLDLIILYNLVWYILIYTFVYMYTDSTKYTLLLLLRVNCDLKKICNDYIIITLYII